MSTLRLGTYQLPAAEVVLVRTLFRLFSHGESFRWTFVDQPPYDALLVDGTSGEATSPEVLRMAKAELRLTRMHADPAPNSLPRPLRADQLQDWLKTTEHELLETRPAPVVPEPMAQTDAPATDPALETGVQPLRFKLRRWPPAALLRGDSNRIRMATLLSRRAFNAAELATVGQQSFSDSQTFLQVLLSTGLVDVQGESLQPAGGAPRAALPVAAPTPSLARGLISGIRRRLGL